MYHPVVMDETKRIQHDAYDLLGCLFGEPAAGIETLEKFAAVQVWEGEEV